MKAFNYIKQKSRFYIRRVSRRLANTKIEFDWWWNVYRGTKCKECADGYFYPHYGVAPHVHVGVSFFGSTQIIPKHQWPDNFVEDKDAPGCGTYYCPNPECKNSYDKTMKKRKVGQL